MKFRIAPLILLPILMLAACEEEAAETIDTSETGGKAAGEILGGTISDDMIPLEQLTSTSPPAEPSATSASANGDAASATEGEAEAPSDAPASETPAEQE